MPPYWLTSREHHGQTKAMLREFAADLEGWLGSGIGEADAELLAVLEQEGWSHAEGLAERA